jgi:uncharacterized protein YjbJ (UPF0337 family)
MTKTGDYSMNNDMLEARWQEVGGQTRKYWGKLTDDDLARIGGNAERLADALEERYGYTRWHAESQSNRWMRDHQVAPVAEV